MENETQSNKPVALKSMLSDNSIKRRFEELLGKKAPGFISSIINVSQSNALLAKADPRSIISSAVVAATLDLPIDKNLGFSWIVPYGSQAQFQIGYKGFIQLAQRSGQYLRLNVVEVYENQFKSYNSITEELDADFSIEGQGDVKGYACYFKLLNGFEKTVYWTKTKVENHARKYSKSFNSGPWKTDFNAMALKTVLKNTLSKWGVLSIEMQIAQKTDQSVIKNVDNDNISVDYVDVFSDFEVVDEEKQKSTFDPSKSAENKLGL